MVRETEKLLYQGGYICKAVHVEMLTFPMLNNPFNPYDASKHHFVSLLE